MRVIAFHHPDYRLVLWPVIGVKHRLRWHNEGFRPALAGKLPRLTVTVPLTPPTAGKSSGRGMVNTICREGAIVAAAGMLFVFRGKLAARQGIDPDDGTVGGIADIGEVNRFSGMLKTTSSRSVRVRVITGWPAATT